MNNGKSLNQNCEHIINVIDGKYEKSVYHNEDGDTVCILCDRSQTRIETRKETIEEFYDMILERRDFWNSNTGNFEELTEILKELNDLKSQKESE